MKHLTISAQTREALISAVSTKTIDGPIGCTIAVLRTGLDRTAKYDRDNHKIWCCGRWTQVNKAVDLVNDYLASVDLGEYRFDYPGARFESKFIHGANDNHILAAFSVARADVLGGV